MAVSIINLDSAQTLPNASSQATNSISPAVNNLLIVSVMSRTVISTAPNQPTASGNNLTWVVVNTVNYDIQGSSRKRLTLFRAMGSNPSSGAITFDFGGQTQTDVCYSIEQASGIDTSGTNGSGAIIQSATNLSDQGGGGLFTVNLVSFSNINNATFGVFTDDVGGSSATLGSGFSQLSQTNTNQCFLAEWKSSNDTTVDATLPTGSLANSGGIAIEIKSAKYTTALNNYQFPTGSGLSFSERIR